MDLSCAGVDPVGLSCWFAQSVGCVTRAITPAKVQMTLGTTINSIVQKSRHRIMMRMSRVSQMTVFTIAFDLSYSESRGTTYHIVDGAYRQNDPRCKMLC